MHQHPFPFDSQIPELADAVDAATMCRLLAQRIWAANAQEVNVEDCRVTRIRYRRGRRCLLQYDVTLHDAGTSSRSRRWLTGTLFAEPGRAERRARKGRADGFIPELSMLIDVFPSDRKLTQAHAVMSGLDAGIEAAALGTFGPGRWRALACATEPVRYREQLSLVVRYTVHAHDARSGEMATRIFYLKIYPELDQARQTFEYLERLSGHAMDSSMGVAIDRPVACFDHLHAVLLPAGSGRPLSDIIGRDNDVEVHNAVREAARALARFNQSQLPASRRFTAAEYVRSLRRPVAMLEWACPGLRTDLQRILTEVSREAPDVLPHPTHRDMKPEHILLDPGRSPSFIDLDSSAAADPVLDASLMLARFEGMVTDDDSRRRMDAISGTFADEYFAAVPRSWRARLPLYYAASLVEVAAGKFHRQTDDWRVRVPELVTAATRVLSRRRRVCAR